MSGSDQLAVWRDNPFFVLELSPQASRVEVERTGQKLIGLLTVGGAGASRYATPFGEGARDVDRVRQAVAALRDPFERVIHELLADVQHAASADPNEKLRGPWPGAARAIGWIAKWAE
jgi:hypothetical protein